MECKSKYCSDSFCKQIELIETLWNVNDDTNVNDVVKIRINRNIVECKYVLQLIKRLYKPELIDTYWNVDYYHN